MTLCEKCAQLPTRFDGLPPDAATAHLGPETRIGASTPHFPKKYLRQCPICSAKWGIAHVSSWDSKWVKLDREPSESAG